jgi:hypothetical protein
MELGAAKTAIQPLATGDLHPVVADRDLARADPGCHPTSDQGHRDGVAVLAIGDQRLGVHPQAGGLAASNGTAGSGRSTPSSRSSASPTVSRRPAIVRGRSLIDAAASRSLSSAGERSAGTGTRWLRRKRPTSPSTPPFSCAPSLPRRVNSEVNR